MDFPLPKNLNLLLSDIILTVEGVDPVELFGENNAKLNLLGKAFTDVTITSRGNSLKLTGEKKRSPGRQGKIRDDGALPARAPGTSRANS